MHFDQNIIFIIVAAVIGISRLVARIAEKSREQQRRDKEATRPVQPARPPLVASAPKTDEQRVREFLEALGAPPGTTPPPKVQGRTDVPPRPMAPIPPPPLSRPFSSVLLKPIAEKARKIFAPQTAGPSGAEEPGAWLRREKQIETAAAEFEAAAPAKGEPAAPPRDTADSIWKNALRSRDSVRVAFVLREILGPPRAFSEPELA